MPRRLTPPERLALLRETELNFDPDELRGCAPGRGWHYDEYRQPLPPEAPGPPAASASWETAQRLVRDYAFADPSIVRAWFEHDAPLASRTMLLELRFLWLRFHVGVRVGEVVDEVRPSDGREARIWGWSYRTLEGHVEQGERFFEVWKWLDTGKVEFRTWALSRSAFRNPVYRLGFFLFGRHRRAEFGRQACERMADLVAVELELDSTPIVE